MKKEYICWSSQYLKRDMNIKIYGTGGTPILMIPTQDAMSDSYESFGMIDTLSDYLDSGRVQLFCIDTVDAESWSNVWGDKGWRADRQEAYCNYVIHEVLPFIQKTNGGSALPIVAGCSLGATHAAILFLRYPELFSGVLAMSGGYDAKYFFDGWMNPVLYHNSPVDFLPQMPKDHPYINRYNEKTVIFSVGQGAWEDEGRRTTAILRDVFKGKGIRAWVDFWGFDVDHDWCWWKKQILYFLPYLLKEKELEGERS